MMLKYFLTMWLEKISGLALVLVKTFQMSVGPDDEIVVGQIPLEQQGSKGEGTWLSSWALDEVTLSSEAFGLVSAKYCDTQITFQFCYILSLSLFFFSPMWLELFCERVQVSCLVEKNTCILCTFAISHAHFEDIKVLGLSVLLWGFSEKTIFPRRLISVKFRIFF